MTEQMPPPQPRDENSGMNTDKWLEPGKANLQAIYILYLVSLLTGITAIIGVVLAYMNRGKSPDFKKPELLRKRKIFLQEPIPLKRTVCRGQ